LLLFAREVWRFASGAAPQCNYIMEGLLVVLRFAKSIGMFG